MAELTDKEKAVYEWQFTVHDFGEEGQKKLKESSVLVSRVGGLGSVWPTNWLPLVLEK